MFEVSPEETIGKTVYEIGNGQWDIPALRSALKEILPQKKAFDDYVVSTISGIGHRTMLLDGRELDHLPRIFWRSGTRPSGGEHGHPEDHGRRTAAPREDILSNVQSMARATLSGSDSLKDFEKAYFARSRRWRGRALLMRRSEGRVDLHELLARELTAHGWEENCRVQMSGPEVALSRGETQVVAMVVHELATNAVKYGAFSLPSGHLGISWTVEGGKDNPELSLEWIEQGVPLASQPDRKGFGSGMIEQSIR